VIAGTKHSAFGCAVRPAGITASAAMRSGVARLWCPRGLSMVLVLALAGCSTVDTVPAARLKQPNLLSFLVDGKATRSEVEARLGQPADSFDSNRLWTYRLEYSPYFSSGSMQAFINSSARLAGEKPSAGPYDYVVIKPKDLSYVARPGEAWATWFGTRFSLVLAFDHEGLLCRHALVRVYAEP